MPRNFSVVEPHPSVVNRGGYIGSGIGGAGNYKHYNRAELTPGPSAQGPAARIPLKKRPDRVVPCGRGGAGNMRRVTNSPEPEMFQFDEEMMKQRETAAPTYHIGRGGAANFVDEMKPRTNRMGSTGSDMSVNSDRTMAGIETLVVHSKSYVVRWLDVPEYQSIAWSVEPHKRSINFGIFKHPGTKGGLTPALPEHEVGDAPDSGVQTPAVDEPAAPATGKQGRRGSVTKSETSQARDKLESLGIRTVWWTGRCEADKVTMGQYDILAGQGGTYGMVFDNTFSRQTSKTVHFVVMTHPTDAPPKSGHHLHYSNTYGGMTNSIGRSNSPSMRPAANSNESLAQSHRGVLEDPRPPSRRGLETKGIEGTSFYTGVLHKKRRKKAQGHAKRFFSLDFTSATLSYYRDRHSSALRGAVPLSLAAVGVNEKNREFSIDSGAEVWHLKALNKKDFEGWREALERASAINTTTEHTPLPPRATAGLPKLAPPPDPAQDREWERVEELVSKVAGTRDAVRGLAKDTDPKYMPGANGAALDLTRSGGSSSETYELVREDLGFRFIAEKVSHHPVRMACQAESLNNGGWSFTQAPQPVQKFWGKSVELNTEGRARVVLHSTGECFSWTQATCFLRNVIAGEKYVEPVQSMTITCESSGARAVATFKAGGMFSGRSEDVTVQLFEAQSDSPLALGLEGKWTESLKRTDTGATIWTAGQLVPDAPKVYGFTAFAAALNEVTAIEQGAIPFTDSRLRPDQAALENGEVDKAEGLKARLEERQRARRKVLESHGQTWNPQFFEKVEGEGDEDVWVLKGGKGSYWERRANGDWQGVLASLAAVAAARSPEHVRKDHHNNHKVHEKAKRATPDASSFFHTTPPCYGGPCRNGTIIPQTYNTSKYAVDGSAIPDVDFDIGESYAGLLPISSAPNSSELYFWFYPSANPQAEDEILIWLNGGPGCSSLEGILQENGPFLWQYGTFKPVKNPYTWVNLTNVVWIEQPAGTGFSQKRGTPAATNELEVAEQFLGFWKNFVDTFGLHNRKVYIAGESYAGYYVPYIADAMHNQTDETYYDVESILFYDPSMSYGVVQDSIPTVPFVEYWSNLFNFNDTFMEDIRSRSAKCGYDDFMDLALTFPPNGTLPTPPNVEGDQEGCDIWDDVITAAQLINPCWDVYQVATTCPLLWDVLGFPGSFDYLPPGAEIYFNRTEVQRAINAPVGPWAECSSGVLDTDSSPPSGLSVLPRVIEKNKKTVIGHGLLDFILLSNGTLMAIQNMTWSGSQGFSTPPSQWDDFFVPYHSELSLGSLAGAGIFGQYHTERDLTFVTIDLSGHMVPQYAPSAAYRQLEFLLGRIDSLGERSDFTTQSGNFGNSFNFTTANATIKMQPKL
ncbi:hypothetical protein BTJ68_07115 [Hortaea werneckii EXF-2000]|uniref:PH domain-containing protein n=1 Tax=Hortaea werneckii EXF-2000 TaxID=1157616 RepID=A0A1Z5TEA2_HORWE|nr:hypothetical protein BTJ68_07115 [Hortaea werneckii EXF-2000]